MGLNTPEFYNAIYRADPDRWMSNDRDAFAFHAISRHIKPETILDIGCGNGHTLAYFHEHWPDVRYRGIDLSHEAIRLARKRNLFGTWLSGSLRNIAVGSDVVLLMGVAEHFEDLGSDLEYLYRIAQDLVLIEVPNCLAYSDIAGEGYRPTSIGSRQNEWHLTRDSWELRLKIAGFKIVERLTGGAPHWEFIWLLK